MWDRRNPWDRPLSALETRGQDRRIGIEVLEWDRRNPWDRPLSALETRGQEACPQGVLETREQEASLGLSSECPRDYVGNRE